MGLNAWVEGPATAPKGTECPTLVPANWRKLDLNCDFPLEAAQSFRTQGSGGNGGGAKEKK